MDDSGNVIDPVVDHHAELHAGFRWHVPARFNIAEVCCARWAKRTPGATAIVTDRGPTARAQRCTYGELQAQANRLANLGLATMELDDTRRAIDYYSQAVDLFGELGDRSSRARHAWMLGMLLQRNGNLARAAEVMQIAVDYEKETGAPGASEHAAQVDRLRRAAP